MANQHPADLLHSASCIARFLAEIAPILSDNAISSGVSEKGAQGLCLVLDGLEKTIEAAAAGLCR